MSYGPNRWGKHPKTTAIKAGGVKMFFRHPMLAGHVFTGTILKVKEIFSLPFLSSICWTPIFTGKFLCYLLLLSLVPHKLKTIRTKLRDTTDQIFPHIGQVFDGLGIGSWVQRFLMHSHAVSTGYILGVAASERRVSVHLAATHNILPGGLCLEDYAAWNQA